MIRRYIYRRKDDGISKEKGSRIWCAFWCGCSGGDDVITIRKIYIKDVIGGSNHAYLGPYALNN